jgi:hypothetical protein
MEGLVKWTLASQLHIKVKLRVLSNQHTLLQFGKGTGTDAAFLRSCSGHAIVAIHNARFLNNKSSGLANCKEVRKACSKPAGQRDW